ncbi:hypothetical protein BJF78_25640 [Pseudonocardia sp. CNS-139]|nr:hypothetical protein BJF78_25640 [Pseudonocardia sp. CNS-139]
MSQPTVREAIRVLEATGFVRVEHGRGTFVHGGVQHFIARSLETLLELEHVGIVEVHEVRTALAQFSIAQAAQRASADDLAEVERRHEAIVALSGDEDTYVIADAIIAFHVAVSRAAHNPLLLALETFLIRIIVDFMVKAVLEGYTENWIDTVRMRIPQREAILNALRSRDADRSLAVTNSYLDSQRAAFLRNKGINSLRLANPGALRLVSTAVVRQ